MNKDFPEVAVVLYDDLKPESADIRDNLQDFTEFKTYGRYQLNVFKTKNITETIRSLSKDGFEWAVVITIGNYLREQNIIFQTIEHAKKENSPLACHILDRGGYYHFHQQWFAIDLRAYSKVGEPAFEEHSGTIELTTRETERCTDNAHDDYTPWWVRPKSENITTYNSDHRYFGIEVIAALVNAGHNITNIPQDIRERKNYCYPGHNHDEILKIMKDPTYEPKDVALWWYNKTLNQITDQLKIGYYVLNTETMLTDPKISERTFDCFVGVCGGIKPALITGQSNFSPDTHAYLFDISQAAIDWQKYMLANWDGDFSKFEALFEQFRFENNTYWSIYFSNQSIDENIDWVLKGAGITREEFYQRWQQYRNLKHTFINLNLIDDDANQQLLNLIKDANKGAYVWLSNAFHMDYLMFYKTKKWTQDKSNSFITDLVDKAPVPMVLENSGNLYFSADVK